MNIKKTTNILFLFCLTIVQLQAQPKRTITDMAGRKVTIPARINKVYTDRFASLIVFAIDSKLACNYTFKVTDEAKKYISANYYTGKIFSEDQDEEILKQKPDLIILSNMTGADAAEEANITQKKLNIPVIVINFAISDYKSMFAFLGNALGRTTQTNALVAYLNKYIDPINAKTKTLPASKRPAIYYAEGSKGLNTEPSGSFHSQVIDFVSARNVAQTSTGGMHGMSAVSMEQVLMWNPDIILVWTGMPARAGVNGAGNSQSTYHQITNDAAWAKIKAVKNKKVYQIPDLPFGWFDRPPTINIIPGVLWAAQTIYPGMFSFDIKTALKEYFSLFYHVELSNKDVEYLLNPS